MEMMISLVLFGVIMGVVFSFLVNSRRSYSQTSDRVMAQQSIRAVLSMVTSEIRSAGCDPEGIGFDAFVVADARKLQYRADYDGNSDTLGLNPAEDVTYEFTLAMEELTRDIGDGSGALTILRNVTDVTFSYFDASGAELTPVPLTPADMALIRYVDVSIDGESDMGQPLHYETKILIRNG